MVPKTTKSLERKSSAVSSSNTTRIIHDFGRDFFFDEAAQKITAVLDQTLQYDFCEASVIRSALDCGEVDTLEHLWKDKEISHSDPSFQITRAAILTTMSLTSRSMGSPIVENVEVPSIEKIRRVAPAVHQHT